MLKQQVMDEFQKLQNGNLFENPHVLRDKWSIDDFRKVYSNCNDVNSFIDAYREAIDVSEEYRKNDIGYRKDDYKMFKAMCYIYGFGIEKTIMLLLRICRNLIFLKVYMNGGETAYIIRLVSQK